VELFGKKWSKIAALMPGRTENQVKNQFNGIIRSLKKKIVISFKILSI
jgi:myb proto-oncogene protein